MKNVDDMGWNECPIIGWEIKTWKLCYKTVNFGVFVSYKGDSKVILIQNNIVWLAIWK